MVVAIVVPVVMFVVIVILILLYKMGIFNKANQRNTLKILIKR
jgi:hypothetical protein